MRKRNIQKIVRLNRKEAQELAAKAKKACLSEAGLIRLLIRGYEPKEKPDAQQIPKRLPLGQECICDLLCDLLDGCTVSG